jgi:glycosyltransferase involved in cell wall biosynthesis
VRINRTAKTVQAKTILFWGAMNRQENEESVLAFLKRFGQRLAEGGYTLYVVGNAPSERVKRLASEHVVVTGFVEDPSPYFLLCEIGVVPLLSGAGIKVKTLEMLRSGITVVSTAIGAEGIDDPQLHVVELDRFMETIERLLPVGKGKLNNG